MSYDYAQALALVGVGVPAHLQAQAAVPVVTGVQAQGDLLIVPLERSPDVGWGPVPVAGVALITSQATGNTHWLHQGQGCAGVRWASAVADRAEPASGDDGWNAWLDQDDPDRDDAQRLLLAYVQVPPRESALLIHTDEHGANGIGPGVYEVRRKREADDDYHDRLLAD